MRSSTAPETFALLTLPGHVPAPARVELVPQSLRKRLALTLLSWGVLWGIIPLVAWVPPHYPWVLAAFAAGVYLPWRYWTGRYRVRAFAGSCPRCAAELQLSPGTRISLPLTVPCMVCHFEPVLEVDFAPPLPSPAVQHRSPDCVGTWELCWLADARFVVCDTCRAHHPAAPEARRAAEEENARGALLARLTAEGDFLP